MLLDGKPHTGRLSNCHLLCYSLPFRPWPPPMVLVWLLLVELSSSCPLRGHPCVVALPRYSEMYCGDMNSWVSQQDPCKATAGRAEISLNLRGIIYSSNFTGSVTGRVCHPLRKVHSDWSPAKTWSAIPWTEFPSWSQEPLWLCPVPKMLSMNRPITCCCVSKPS